MEALEAGADDSVTKPHRLRKLIARLRAVLRRLFTGWLLPSDSRFFPYGFRLRFCEAVPNVAVGQQICRFSRVVFELLA